MRLRLGTRGSALAVAQSTQVAEALTALGHEVELVRIKTGGDVLTGSLTSLGGLGVFAAELRRALLDGRADFAVHSLKDLPTAPVPGLTIAAVPRRADARDVLCARGGLRLAELPAGSAVGTGSPRRVSQLRALRPDLRYVDVRGNVGTRLARVADGDLDAVVLAAAGLARLGLEDHITDHLPILPAPGQGALALECRVDDEPVLGALTALDDPATRSAVDAERAGRIARRAHHRRPRRPGGGDRGGRAPGVRGGRCRGPGRRPGVAAGGPARRDVAVAGRHTPGRREASASPSRRGARGRSPRGRGRGRRRTGAAPPPGGARRAAGPGPVGGVHVPRRR